ncbi:unnamed protein product [Owenia fusiformis]|uniref:Uncharacterized protein n=1 Tax=Owenia fusiformis TaxID=6347 RepID=A0A8J1UZ67_OWEFU|nr:unnamed protein product [Owenia fusiformis]
MALSNVKSSVRSFNFGLIQVIKTMNLSVTKGTMFMMATFLVLTLVRFLLFRYLHIFQSQRPTHKMSSYHKDLYGYGRTENTILNLNDQGIANSRTTQNKSIQLNIFHSSTESSKGWKHTNINDKLITNVRQKNKNKSDKNNIKNLTQTTDEHMTVNDGNVKKRDTAAKTSQIAEQLALRTILNSEQMWWKRFGRLVTYFNSNSKRWYESRQTYIHSQNFSTIPCYAKTKIFIDFEKSIANIEKALVNVNSKYGPIIFLYADSGRLEELLNGWLLAKFIAKMELHNLIVATDDIKLCPILSKLSINIIAINANTTKFQKNQKYEIWTYRLILWRLLDLLWLRCIQL